MSETVYWHRRHQQFMEEVPGYNPPMYRVREIFKHRTEDWSHPLTVEKIMDRIKEQG